MFCRNCGKKLNDDARFCDKCGSQVVQWQPVDSHSSIRQPLGMNNPLGGKLPLLICLCATAAIITISAVALIVKIGFGDRDVPEANSGAVKESDGDGLKTEADGSDKATQNADTIKVTKKLEKQYLERIEAYKDYYEKEKSDGEKAGVNISLDEDGLPLLWMYYFGENGYDDISLSQLLVYEDKEVKVLAEVRDVYLGPIMTDGVVAAYTYDTASGGIYVLDKEKKSFKDHQFTQETLLDVMLTAGVRVFTYLYAYNDVEQTIAYIGKVYDSNMDFRMEGTCVYPDASEEPLQDAYRRLERGRQDGWRYSAAVGAIETFLDNRADALFRVLTDTPAYTSKDFMMMLVANDIGYNQSGGRTYVIVDDFDFKADTPVPSEWTEIPPEYSAPLHSMDMANERAAKATALIMSVKNDNAAVFGYYDVELNEIAADGSSIKPYGKHGDHLDQILQVSVDAEGNVGMRWVDAGVGAAEFNTAITSSGLCSQE